jgi:hypothetical protein
MPEGNGNGNGNGNMNLTLNSSSSSSSPEGVQGESRQPGKLEKPTIEEIRNYLRSRKSTVDAEAFYSFYESNGWKVGRNPMRSWKAAVVTWEKNGFDSRKKDDFVAPSYWKPLNSGRKPENAN